MMRSLVKMVSIAFFVVQFLATCCLSQDCCSRILQNIYFFISQNPLAKCFHYLSGQMLTSCTTYDGEEGNRPTDSFTTLELQSHEVPESIVQIADLLNLSFYINNINWNGWCHQRSSTLILSSNEMLNCLISIADISSSASHPTLSGHSGLSYWCNASQWQTSLRIKQSSVLG